ncbi:EthD domain-containing protein [Rhizobium sp. CSW-27]|uniref:EthD domain-containing protein n=1 Tax=Rhizobium sp. CSW-27 TaxID=2839985 RepID=UPI001C02FDCC|nr:EthD domain-containing protein [Rhizobium sp. CSW-27]MBT9371320.1 EthD domain-containing protein [Rhizobium sp. CSW-27]
MSIKILMVGRRRPGQTLMEHRTHMKDVHGRLVLDYIAAEPENAPRRYVQNHVFDGIYPGGEGLADVFTFGPDFVTEVWFPDLAALKASRETAFYRMNLLPDEPRMVDGARVIGIPSTEEVVRAPEASARNHVKVFVFWHSGPAEVAALLEALGAAAVSALGHCRSTPAVPSPVKAVDAFWLANEETGQVFAQDLREAVLHRLPAGQGSISIALAREYVLHAG